MTLGARAGRPPAPGDASLIQRGHAAAIQNLFDAVVVTDLQGRVVEWNPGSERLYGYARDEMLGQSVTILHTPEEQEHVLPQVMAALEREGRWQDEIGVLRKDGSRGWIESCVVTLTDEDGRPVGALGINRDITARVRAERKRAEADARFRSIVESALVGIYMIGEGGFLFVNPRFEEIFGYSAQELTGGGVSYLELVAARDRARMAENVRQRLSGEPLEQHYSFEGVRKDGRVITLEVHGTRIQWDGRPTIIGTVLDVSERMEAERRIRESEERHRQIVDEMFGRVAEVLASRTRLREQLLPTNAGAPPTPMGVDEEDERFLRTVRDAVLENLGDERFTVDGLAARVAQSRSQLHRRLRHLVNETPSQLIKRMRLEQAARQLADSSGPSVAEIAYSVGFKTVPHFSSSFLDAYGLRPTAYRERASSRV